MGSSSNNDDSVKPYHTNCDAQLEALKEENVANKFLRDMDKQFELRNDGTRYFMNQI